MNETSSIRRRKREDVFVITNCIAYFCLNTGRRCSVSKLDLSHIQSWEGEREKERDKVLCNIFHAAAWETSSPTAERFIRCCCCCCCCLVLVLNEVSWPLWDGRRRRRLYILSLEQQTELKVPRERDWFVIRSFPLPLVYHDPNLFDSAGTLPPPHTSFNHRQKKKGEKATPTVARARRERGHLPHMYSRDPGLSECIIPADTLFFLSFFLSFLFSSFTHFFIL